MVVRGYSATVLHVCGEARNCVADENCVWTGEAKDELNRMLSEDELREVHTRGKEELETSRNAPGHLCRVPCLSRTG